MAIKLEEVRIKAGLDYSKVTAGLTDIRQQVFNLAKGVPAMLTGMLRTNLVGIGAMLLKDVLPTWDEIWNKVYGVDEETTKKLKESGENLKKLRQEVQTTAATLDKTARDINFAESDPKGKVAILEAEAQMAKQNADAALKQLKWAKDYKLSVEDLGKAQREYNKALEVQLKSEFALREMQKKLSPEDLRAEYERKLKEAIPQVYQDRISIRALRGELELDPNNTDMRRQLGEAEGRIAGVMRARRGASLAGVTDALGSAAYMIPGLKEAIQPLLVEQERMMRDTIQKVRIVEVE
jgi:hypothetical protein